MGIADRRTVWPMVAGLTVAGLVLRCLAARGGLWLDEAWSAMFGQDIGTPAGVFLRINHDNNHHLNTLWLQFVGRDASPILQRGLSIASGTATIPLAAIIAARRGAAAAILAAIAFAFAPFLVTYGSEARGYAPMLLAWVAAIGMVDRWLADPREPMPATGLALSAIFGCLAQATMLFGLAALGGWVISDRWRRAGFRWTAQETFRLMGPAAAVALLLVAVAWAAAQASPTGFQFGNREPHDWRKWLEAIDQLWNWTFGLSIAVVPVAAFGLFTRDRIGGLALWTAIALPITVASIALPNSGASRYYAVAVPPLLLWASIALPFVWRGGSGWRIVAIAVGVAFLAGAAKRDSAMTANLRGDPGRAVTALAARSPNGATVSVELSRSTAILIAAARAQGYRIAVPTAPCPAAPFRFVERDGDASFPAPMTACGRTYRPIAHGDPTGLSGTHWRLYARTR